ncbi:MAG: PD-(D/E)XK nuclease family protein [Sedimentisphaerales bacterium]|nr:PD-(D/E)XK nuclease family protein [Sedimentisphaerales bacterium]
MNIQDLRRDIARYWSQSRVSCFLRCSLQYAFRYVYRVEPAFTPAALSLGSSVHRVMEMVSLLRREGDIPTADECADLFAEIWSRQLQEDRNIRFKPDENAESCRQQGQQIVRTFRENIDEREQVLEVSAALAVPLITSGGDILPDPLIGEIDLLVRTPEGQKLIVDWKTAASRWPVAKEGERGKADREVQPTALLYAYKMQHGEVLGFRYDIVVKNKTPVFQRITTSRTQDDFDRLVAIIAVIDAMTRAEHFLPNDTGFMCGDCEYADACQNWNRDRRRLVSCAA